MKLNKSTVDAIPLTEKGQLIYRDSDLTGFAVRATNKSKVYIVERRSSGKLYRVTIGKTNEITVVEAKKKAQQILADISNGNYIKEKNTNNDPTLNDAFELYLKQR